MALNFTATRIYQTAASSVAIWSGPKIAFPLYCLEPGEQREPHPRIPAGTYPLRLRTVGKKHADYLKHYGSHFHKGMVEIAEVPGREFIELHVGNTIADTLGCSLPGLSYGKDEDGNYAVAESRRAYEKAYPILRDAILAGATQLIIKPAAVA